MTIASHQVTGTVNVADRQGGPQSRAREYDKGSPTLVCGLGGCLLGDTVARVGRRPGDRLEVCVNLGAGWQKRYQKGTAPTRSGAFRWAEGLGLLGLKATEKRMPPGAFGLCDDQVALLLGRFLPRGAAVHHAGSLAITCNRPARTNDDLPHPEGPATNSTDPSARSAGDRNHPASCSTSALRPKNTR